MSRSYKHVPCYKDHNRGMKNVPIEKYAEIILSYYLEWHIKNYFVLMKYAIISLYVHLLLIKRYFLKITVKCIQIKNCIECGIKITK